MEIPTEENAGDTFPRWMRVMSMRTLVGVGALILLFFMGAGFTLAYLSNASPRENRTQVAAGATYNDPFASLSLKAQGVYVLDLTTDAVLFSKNPDVQLPLASLAKIPLVLAVSEVLSPETIITIPHDTAPKGSAERLGAGEKWRVGDVINFTLVASSNAGAEILASVANPALRARYPKAPEDAALWRMNDLTQGLGLSHTYFLNVSGLDASPTQSGAYGSARDMALLFAYAASTSPSLFEGTARDGLLLTSIGGEKTSAFNTDKALGSIPGLIMGKTGLTSLAGGNLAIAFDVGPVHPVVAVVLGSTSEGRFDDMKQLVNAVEEVIAHQ